MKIFWCFQISKYALWQKMKTLKINGGNDRN